MTVVVLLPGIVTRPVDAPPYVVGVWRLAAILGLLVGLVLRFTALVALWIAGRERRSSHGAA